MGPRGVGANVTEPPVSVMISRRAAVAASRTAASAAPTSPSSATVSTSWPAACRGAAARDGRFSSSLTLTTHDGGVLVPGEIGAICRRGTDAVDRERRILREDLIFGHAGGQCVEDHADHDPRPADDCLPVTDGGVSHDELPLSTCHVLSVRTVSSLTTTWQKAFRLQASDSGRLGRVAHDPRARWSSRPRTVAERVSRALADDASIPSASNRSR